MRVYFLSCTPAALKLNGLYLGTIDGFERRIDLDPAEGILAEIIPDGNLQPLNFFLNARFFEAPPAFADVYRLEGGALVYIREYAAKDVTLSVISQTRFGGNLVTVFAQGNIYLSVEGESYSLTTLPRAFKGAEAEVKRLAGREVLALSAENRLIVISDKGKIIFSNAAESAEFSNALKICAPFETCTAAKAECVYGYDGENLTLLSSRTIETRPPEREILHFAFFESVLTRGGFAEYLTEDLKLRAGDLQSYLGAFVGVTVPTESFYAGHGDIAAAGLVYPLAQNLYEIKYFAVELDGDRISNVYPVE